jgi:ornithine carbamoyltransferase
MKRDFTKLLDLTRGECLSLLDRTRFLKDVRRARGTCNPLKGRTLAMIFEKASTRTRISFEVGVQELGGRAVFLSPTDTQMGRGEPVRDTARVLSRYVDAIMIRTFAQETVEELARWASIPVINGLSDLYHPCQVLADLFTVTELKGDLRNVKVAWVGDGNNMANSWLEASILLGFRLSIASPPGYGPDEALAKVGMEKGLLTLSTEPAEAVSGADVINTDVWTSMGMEEEKEARRKAFASFRVDGALLRGAKPDAVVLHCLPAPRGEEVTEEVFEGFQEVIFTQAENRLHAQKALLEWLIREEEIHE